MCGVKDLLERLIAAPGIYRGHGDGPESGPFVARIAVTPVVRGRAVIFDYEATSDSDGLQHAEHTVLAADDDRLTLHVVSLDVPGVVRFTESAAGEFTAYDGPIKARIVIATPKPATLTYAWWWSRDGGEPKEQSRADVRRTG